jgi:hypothetical protein
VLHQLDLATAWAHAEWDEEVDLQLPRQFVKGKVLVSLLEKRSVP